MSDRIVIAGAGSIGIFVGGLLAAAGRDVVMLARPRIVAELEEHGLGLSSFEGWSERLEPAALSLTADPAEAFRGSSLLLVTVKSGDTAAMADLVAAHAPAEAAVVSLQNGLDNAALLRDRLPGRRVLAGMVPFNVVALGHGRWHKGTSGSILIDPDREVVAKLDVPHLPVAAHPDMRAVLAGKLLLNLNNALNALSGLTLFEQLGNRAWRRVLARCQAEALAVFRAAGIAPWSMGPLPASALPAILRLPTLIFRLLARASVTIDRTARSSMWEDLARGRPTEIGELQGKIVALAAEQGIATPVNAAVLQAVRDAEASGGGAPALDPADLRKAATS